ncbi:unnamed protein product, partial [Brassica rapa subsp. narinosa]
VSFSLQALFRVDGLIRNRLFYGGAESVWWLPCLSACRISRKIAREDGSVEAHNPYSSLPHGLGCSTMWINRATVLQLLTS